jgi:diadenosine tetraphosphate (Ap4A) HIT family hydrolase
MKKPDNLFQQKLKNYSQTPSEEAWAKIGAHLYRQRRKGLIFYLSIAASITVAITLGILVAVQQNKKQVSIAIDIQTISGEVAAEMIQGEKAVEKQQFVAQAEQQTKQDSPQQKEAIKTTVPHLHRHVIAEDKEEFAEPPGNKIVAEPTIALNENVEKETLQDENPGTIAAASNLPAITITYRRSLPREDVQEKQEEKPKENTFQTMIMLAQDIKNTGFGLSDLRQAKDNLLDIDLRRIETRLKNN